MISRNLTRRLEELEARIAPAGEATIIQITYVSPDGSTEAGPRFEVPAAGDPLARRDRGARAGFARPEYRGGRHP